MQKLLAAPQTSHLNLYALDRLASCLEEPYRGVAKKRLRSTLAFRGLDVPKLAKPLSLPLLANKLFKKNVQSWIVKVRKTFSKEALPFHLPTKQIVEKRHCSIGDRLFNFRRWMQKFTICPQEAFCNCRAVLQKHPDLECVDGHIASAASRLSVSKHVKRLLASSSSCCFYPRRNAYSHIGTSLSKKCVHGLCTTVVSRLRRSLRTGRVSWMGSFRSTKGLRLGSSPFLMS